MRRLGSFPTHLTKGSRPAWQDLMVLSPDTTGSAGARKFFRRRAQAVVPVPVDLGPQRMRPYRDRPGLARGPAGPRLLVNDVGAGYQCGRHSLQHDRTIDNALANIRPAG